jgi:hypothetical protein
MLDTTTIIVANVAMAAAAMTFSFFVVQMMRHLSAKHKYNG